MTTNPTTTMKKVTAFPGLMAIVFAAAIAIATGDANATGVKPPAVVNPPAAGEVDNHAEAAATAIGAGTASGTGRAQADSHNTNTLAPSQSLIDGSKAYSLSFAPPAWATLPVATNCMASSNKARSIGFGAASWADAGQSMDAICTAIELAQRARLACHFESAWLLETRVAEHLGTTLGAPPAGLRNWSPDECETLRRPALRMTQTMQPALLPQPINHNAITLGMACTQPATAATPSARTATRKATPKPAPKPATPACTN